MLPKPQSRLEVLLNKIATNTMNDLPIPQSRLELLVSALITNDTDNLPSPQSRSEAILHCILLDTECNISPQSRVELFLKSIITLDIEGLPTPLSRIEWYLDYIVRNGCLEKYEYYPFQIRDYLNVNNTPKAKMKFKCAKGNTLVNENFNFIDNEYAIKDDDGIVTFSSNVQGYVNSLHLNTEKLKPISDYTIVLNILENTLSDQFEVNYKELNGAEHGTCIDENIFYPAGTTGLKVIKVRTKQDVINQRYLIEPRLNGTTGRVKYTLMILEGDYTQNPPSYFEGMKSFGESENKIEVLSYGVNLFDGVLELGSINVGNNSSSNNQIRTKNFTSVKSCFVYVISGIPHYTVYFYDKDKNFISEDARDGGTAIRTPSNCRYLKFRTWSTDNIIDININISINIGTTPMTYKPYQSSKAIPMYRNTTGELVPVPVLRGKWQDGKFLWGDEILEHDGKLYYHKRCEEYLLNGTEVWMLFPGDSTNPRSFYYSLLPGYKFSFDFMVDNRPMIKSKTQDGCWRFDSTDIKIAISDNQSKFATIADFQQHIKENNLRVVLQLPYEEVYPCELTEQLYSYDGETNIFINGGDVVGETTIEIGTKLGPIVAVLKQETKIVTDGLKGVLAGNMQELAYQLYPDDFNKDNTVEIKPIESA